MKFFVSNYSSLQNPSLGGYRTQIPVLSVLNWICWNPPPYPKKIPVYATAAIEESHKMENTEKKEVRTQNASSQAASPIARGCFYHNAAKGGNVIDVYLKECHHRCVYQNYSRSMIKE